jgi:hypothetical protein
MSPNGSWTHCLCTSNWNRTPSIQSVRQSYPGSLYMPFSLKAKQCLLINMTPTDFQMKLSSADVPSAWGNCQGCPLYWSSNFSFSPLPQFCPMPISFYISKLTFGYRHFVTVKVIHALVSEVPTAVTMKGSVICVVTPCSSHGDRRFRRTFRLHLPEAS